MTSTSYIKPRESFDFIGGVLDPRITITRALNTATRVNVRLGKDSNRFTMT